MSPNSCSVVIPSYNHVRFIEQAVESVRAQSRNVPEIIIVDDGSNDGSIELLGTYKKTAGIRVIFQDHQGAHAAINHGIAESSGDYIAILNSDDVYHAARVEKLLARAGRSHDFFFAFTKIDFVDTAGLSCPNCTPRRLYEKHMLHFNEDSSQNPFYYDNLSMTSSNFFFSRSIHQKVGPFRNLRYVHDWDWALRATVFAKPVFVDEPLLSYRVHPGNTLSETDTWRHMLENAFFFASALRHERIAVHDENVFFNRLLKSEAFIPVLTLYFLSLLKSGTAEEALLEKIDSGYFQDTLSACLAAGKTPIDILMSANHLSRKLSPVNRVWSVFKRLAPSLARHFTYSKTIRPS